jgi:hypothetical protein
MECNTCIYEMSIRLICSVILLSIGTSACTKKGSQNEGDYTKRRAPVENVMAQNGYFGEPEHKSIYSFQPYIVKNVTAAAPESAQAGNATAGNSTFTSPFSSANKSSSSGSTDNSALLNSLKTLMNGQGNSSGQGVQTNSTGIGPQSDASDSLPSDQSILLAANSDYANLGQGSSAPQLNYYDTAEAIPDHEIYNPHDFANNITLAQTTNMAGDSMDEADNSPELPNLEQLQREGRRLPERQLSDVPPSKTANTHPDQNVHYDNDYKIVVNKEGEQSIIINDLKHSSANDKVIEIGYGSAKVMTKEQEMAEYHEIAANKNTTTAKHHEANKDHKPATHPTHSTEHSAAATHKNATTSNHHEASNDNQQLTHPTHSTEHKVITIGNSTAQVTEKNHELVKKHEHDTTVVQPKTADVIKTPNTSDEKVPTPITNSNIVVTPFSDAPEKKPKSTPSKAPAKKDPKKKPANQKPEPAKNSQPAPSSPSAPAYGNS